MYLDNIAILAIALTSAVVLFLLLAVTFGRLLRERARASFLEQRETELLSEAATLKDECESLRRENLHFREENASLRTLLDEKEIQAGSREELLAAAGREMEKSFRLLAERIFTEKGAALTQSHRTELNRLLQPVREQLGEFRKKVEDVYDRESRDRVSLVKEIEHLKSLNQQVSRDAVNLANALRGQSKVRGQWGEMILESLLEHSGLRKGEEYLAQPSFRDRKGRIRMPDILVRLPGKREILIDAKVSLKAYEKACASENRDEESRHLRAHVDSVRQHMRGLADKEYHLLEGINSLDFTILFIPVEGAFQAAVSADPDLLTDGSRNRIVPAGPSTLIAILRIVHHLWRQEEQTRNSLAIAKQAGNLYDKFMGFLESFEEIGSRLNQSLSAWETARNRLVSGRGSLLSRTQNLRKLGVQSSKTPPASLQAEEME
ncbi:MAG: DNA recombination protein RmuC [Desulfobulbaceae bacterium]